MIDRKLFQKTFSALHASPDTLSEVYKVVRRNKRHHTITKGMLVAAVLAMCITVAGAVGIATLIKADVAPADSITDADRNAFDKDTVGSDTPLVLGNDGQPISLPRMERASTDTATVQRLLGDYLCTVNATMEVDGYTIKLNTFLIDENGSGFLTYTLSNPNGVEPDENGYGEVFTPLNPSLIIGDDPKSFDYMDAKTYLDTAASTDTELRRSCSAFSSSRFEKISFSIISRTSAAPVVLSVCQFFSGTHPPGSGYSTAQAPVFCVFSL